MSSAIRIWTTSRTSSFSRSVTSDQWKGTSRLDRRWQRFIQTTVFMRALLSGYLPATAPGKSTRSSGRSHLCVSSLFFFSALNVPSCLIRDAGDAPELLSPWELEPCLERSHTTRKNANRTALPARPTVNSLPSQGYSFELCLLLPNNAG